MLVKSYQKAKKKCDLFFPKLCIPLCNHYFMKICNVDLKVWKVKWDLIYIANKMSISKIQADFYVLV